MTDYPQQTEVFTESRNEYFEQVRETDYIVIPKTSRLEKYIKHHWSNCKEILTATPSTALEAGTRKKIKIFRPKQNVSVQQCIDFIKSIPGGTLPNVFGLAFAAMFTNSALPQNCWIFGFDNRDNLPVLGDDIRIPNLHRQGSLIVYYSFLWENLILKKNSYFIVLCD